MTMLSPLGRAVIQLFEDYRNVAYQKFPGEPWTAGWGHTGPDVKEGTVCTPDEAEEWFTQDIQHAEHAVVAYTGVLSQHQFDALVSFVYNLGAGAFAQSTLLRLLNARQISQAADEFLKWDNVDGKPNAGLLRRRTLERALFLDGIV